MTKSSRLAAAIPGGAPVPERVSAWIPGRPRGGIWIREEGKIDSVQWLDLPGPGDLDLVFLETIYYAWVPCMSVGTVKPRTDGSSLSLGLVPLHWPIAIRMAEAETTDTARVRPILGGMLAHPGGSMGFYVEHRPFGVRLVVAMRELHPRLPLWLYFIVQARLHERATFAFLRQVRRVWARRDTGSGTLS